MTKSLFDTNVDAVEDIREHPHGKYSGKLIQAAFKTIEEEKEVLSLSFRATAAAEDLDLAGVELNRLLYREIWFTPNSIKRAKDELKKAGVPMETGDFRTNITSIEGADVEFTVGVDKYHANKGDTRPRVQSFRLV